MKFSAFGVIALILFGCSPWPPHEDELTANFQRHRAAFEELADMFSASPYPYVRPGDHPFLTEDVAVDLDSDVLRQFKTTEGLVFTTSKIAEDGTEFYDQPVDDPVLIALINTIGLPTLGRGYEGERIYFIVHSSDPDEHILHIAYTRDHVSKVRLQLCIPTFNAYDCGRCKIDLDDDWYIYYAWSPPYFDLLERYGDKGVYERHLQEPRENELTEDEIRLQRRSRDEEFGVSFDACQDASEPVIHHRKDLFKRS